MPEQRPAAPVQQPPPQPAPTPPAHDDPFGDGFTAPEGGTDPLEDFDKSLAKWGTPTNPASVEQQSPADPDQAPPANAEVPPEGGEPPKEGEAPPAAANAPVEPERPKQDRNFWRGYDELKNRATKAEARVAELEKGVVPEAERTALTKELEDTKAKLAEITEELRFADYTKHPEFKQKFVKPYEKKWVEAMGELKAVPVTDPTTGETRNATPEDLKALIDLELLPARELADQMFGRFAGDAMNHRAKIREILTAQREAVADARKNGAAREKQRAEQAQQHETALKSFVGETWNKATKAIIEDKDNGVFFKPVEGNQEINQRLAKGFEMVDRAFAESPTEPGLKPEEIARRVQRHAAVRHRAAAFGRMKFELTEAQGKIATLEKQLAEFRQSTPGTGPNTPEPAEAPAGDGLKDFDTAFNRNMAKYATRR